MSTSEYVDSYYAASRHPAPSHAPLAGDVDCDVCVVGGGIAGCSAALHLAERGYRVVLLEAARIGWGASGRSGAQALFGLAAGEEKTEALVGREDARRIWDMTVEGLALMRGLIARHAIDCDYVPGQMHVAVRPRQVGELRNWVDLIHARYDYRSLRFVPREELRDLIASERYLAGTFDSNSAHLHPLNYTLGIAAAAGRAGVRIHEGSRALDYEAGEVVTVRTAQGRVRCRHLALCGNAWLGDTAPAIARRIMPVGTYIVATEPLGLERARALIANDAAVTDINWILDYFRLSRDHRLLFGGRVSYSGLDPFNTAQATRQRMLRVFPQLADARIAYSWGGYVDITLNRAPDFGRLAPNVYYLQGFSGHGIVLTGIAGKLLAEAVAGTAERFDVFARIRHREFPGGALLRRPALVLAMAWYRLRDLL
ncbi:MAG TPA: FAD-binding oxidoreductase [Steroidobacteraceae bacterium]|nr:FAD-binding oxidoreductase [Steroidobacteraceae bacterium]HNS27367.1 FAD-binding oxidoreductase [Steroidobacteraceae bacterium]